MIELEVILLMLPGVILSVFIMLWVSTDHERAVQERARERAQRRS